MEKLAILVVDDEAIVALDMSRRLERLGYMVAAAAYSGEAAIERAADTHPDLVLMDIRMPGNVDGIEAAEQIRERFDIPVAFVTAYADDATLQRVKVAGPFGYVVKPVDDRDLHVTVEVAFHRHQMEKELRQSFAKLQRVLEETVQAVAMTLEMRDPYTAGHQRNVEQLACAIAREMELAEEQIQALRVAALCHDLGKISVPAEILTKPGRLTEVEFTMVKSHPQVGYDILKTIEFPWPVAQIVLQHHERMDGSGYPQGLLDKDIIVQARVLGVADAVEAMSSHRPYRPALGIDKALAEVSQKKGVLYDPKVVDACVKLFTEKRFNFN